LNRLFFAVQNLLKYVPFGWGIGLRGLCYRPFFARLGSSFVVSDGATIKYPDQIAVGDHVTINTGCFIVGRGGLTIGNDVMIGAGAKIVTTSHRHERTDIPMRVQGLETTPILIEDDVWLGFDVVVLPGATIRRGAIVGAGAVVSGEIPKYAIAAGSPARVIRTRERT
jgi:maltose O-acetyltransferase